ncbi:hypothetical protein GOP47_0028086 [Adiantum capillus-veneris]|nr:hypothetical protein GOP47_0028086 [Adiantum capillus-veneris]
MAKVQELLGRLQRAMEEAHRVQTMEDLGQEHIEGDVCEVLLKARAIKVKVGDLDASKASVTRKTAGCGLECPLITPTPPLHMPYARN